MARDIGLRPGPVAVDQRLRRRRPRPFACEQGIERPGHPAGNLPLELLGDDDLPVGDRDEGFGRLCLSPGRLGRCEPVERFDTGLLARDNGLRLGRADPRRAFAAALPKSFVEEGRLRSLDRRVGPGAGDIFGLETDRRLGADTGLSHGCIGGLALGHPARAGQIGLRGLREDIGEG